MAIMSAINKSLLYGSRDEDFPEPCREYYLFLLEFFVKQASGDRLAKLNQMFFVPTSVHFEFLDFVNENDLTVTPVDLLFQPQAGIANDIEIFNTGKSVLFAVDHEGVTDRTIKMILKIIAKKQMPDNIKPDNILVGVGELDLSGQYAALRLEMLQYWRKGVTISKIFDGQIPLIYNENSSGNLDIFVRMSGLGQTIVTEFDAPIAQDPSTFIFSSEEHDQVLLSYKCRKMDSRTINLFKDFSEELGESPTSCPVCVPKKYSCVPCEKLEAVEERNKEEITQRKDTSSKSLIRFNRDLTQSCGKPVVLKVSGLFNNDIDGKKKPTVTIVAESAAIKPDEPSDPDHDIFILRIGKKGLVGIGEKSDLQLEMKTPKGSERRPPIRYETRDMQTEKYEEEPPKNKKNKKKKN